MLTSSMDKGECFNHRIADGRCATRRHQPAGRRSLARHLEWSHFAVLGLVGRPLWLAKIKRLEATVDCGVTTFVL